jgi:hypothetical protein
MNMRVTQESLNGGTPAPFHARKERSGHRLEILDEVIAGFLWLHLDLPDDVSRSEIETFARRLVARINIEADETAIQSELVLFQRNQFCRPINMDVARNLARRSIAAVKGH